MEIQKNQYFHNHMQVQLQSQDSNVVHFQEENVQDEFAAGDILEDADFESASTITTRTDLSHEDESNAFHHPHATRSTKTNTNFSLQTNNINDNHNNHRQQQSFYHQQQYYQRKQQRCLNVFLSEFLGTLLFVFMSQAAISSFELIGTQNDTIGRSMATIFGRSIALLAATLLTINISGAHLNPAYSLSSAFFRHVTYRNALSRMCAQYSGAFLGAFLLHLTYYDKLNQRHSEGLLMGKNYSLRSHGNLLSTGKFFSSFPPTEVSHLQLFASYMLANANFALLAATILAQKQQSTTTTNRHDKSLRPIHLALSYGLVLAAFSANGGPVLNPAQDFASRLYMALTSWGSSAFNLYHGHYWWLCGILAPHAGFALGFGVHKVFCNLQLAGDEPSSAGSLIYHQRQRINTKKRPYATLPSQYHHPQEKRGGRTLMPATPSRIEEQN